MKKFRSTVTAMLVAIAALHAQDKKDENPAAALEKAGAVGPQHKKLAEMAGDWTYVGKFWMTPDAKPTEMTGESKRTVIMGGRFVRDEISSEGFGGFKGLGLMGYDNLKKRYVNTWIDSMSTGIYVTNGTEKGNVYTFRGSHLDPVTGKSVKTRDVVKIVSKDKQVMEMYHLHQGSKKEVKVMEIVYTRKK